MLLFKQFDERKVLGLGNYYDDDYEYDPDAMSLYSEDYDPDEEVESLMGTIDVADCPCCGKHATMTQKPNGLFTCSHCGFTVDEETLVESLIGLTKFDFS